MSSPELLLKQAERWLNNKNKQSEKVLIDVKETEKEIAKLKDQEDRYAKAYGVGAITLDQLKQYTTPIKDRISFLSSQITTAEMESGQEMEKAMPMQSEVEVFAKKALKELQNLSFSSKKAIVRNIIDKVVGTTGQLQVYGYIPVTSSDINVFTEHRNCWFAERRKIYAF